VFGIYGAFALERWNENRLNEIEEEVLLIDLRTDLIKTISDFKLDTIANSNHIREARKIEKYITLNLPYTTELDNSFGGLPSWRSPYIKSLAYQSLKSKGIDIIKNRDLRNAISNLYDGNLSYVKEDYDRTEWLYLETSIIPFYSKNILRIDDQSNMNARPNNFETLKDDQEFKNILSTIIRMRKQGLGYYRTTMVEIEGVIALIDQELKK
jgi:hypothetical protein